METLSFDSIKDQLSQMGHDVPDSVIMSVLSDLARAVQAEPPVAPAPLPVVPPLALPLASGAAQPVAARCLFGGPAAAPAAYGGGGADAWLSLAGGGSDAVLVRDAARGGSTSSSEDRDIWEEARARLAAHEAAATRVRGALRSGGGEAATAAHRSAHLHLRTQAPACRARRCWRP